MQDVFVRSRLLGREFRVATPVWAGSVEKRYAGAQRRLRYSDQPPVALNPLSMRSPPASAAIRCQHPVFRHALVLRAGTAEAHVPCGSEDLIPRLESPNRTPDHLDLSGELRPGNLSPRLPEAEHQTQGRPDPRSEGEASRSYVPRLDCGCVNAHQHFVLLGDRLLDLLDLQDLWRSISGAHDCSQVRPFPVETLQSYEADGKRAARTVGGSHGERPGHADGPGLCRRTWGRLMWSP